MRAKMMILSGSEEAASLSLRLQQMLTDLAVAFGHSFVMVEDKISSLSSLEYGSPMTEEAVDAALECDSTLCITPNQAGLAELAEGLDCILRCHVYALPESLSGYSRLKSGKLPRGILACPIVLEERALKGAADHVFSLAKDTGMTLTEIPYSRKRRELWEMAAMPASARYYLNQRRISDVPDFIRELIMSPDGMGVLMAAPSSCNSIHAMAASLSGLEPFIFDSFWDNHGPRLYAVELKDPSSDSINPFGVLYAAADMLKYRLGLSREADFLHTCCNNVLDAGWRTADIAGDNSMRVSTEAIFRLVSEQIDLVATLGAH